MPTGMDTKPEEDPLFELGERIINKINREKAKHTHAIVLGDFNEVRKPRLDRLRAAQEVVDEEHTTGRLVGQLVMTDCQRVLHPHTPLYTNYQPVAGPHGCSAARLDYCLVSPHIKPLSCKTEGVAWVTTHVALVTTVHIPEESKLPPPWQRPKLNTPKATEAHWISCREAAHEALFGDADNSAHAHLQMLKGDPSEHTTDSHFTILNTSIFQAASTALPDRTGPRARRPPFHTRIGRSLLCKSATQRLATQTRLLVMGRITIHDGTWIAATHNKWLPKRVTRLNEATRLSEVVDTDGFWKHEENWNGLRSDALFRRHWNNLLRLAHNEATQRAKKMIHQRKKKKETEELMQNPQARLRHIMQKQSGGAIDHVITTEGKRIDGRDELHQELVSHYQTVFCKPRDENIHVPRTMTDVELSNVLTEAATHLRTGFPDIADHILSRRGELAHYAHIMQRPTETELLEYLRKSSSTGTAAGGDGTNKQAWKQLLQDKDILEHVLDVFGMYLQTGCMPQTEVVVQCIAKKPNVPLEFKQLRPISLQSSLLKIFTGLLAKRLTRIFFKHQTLDPAQEAYIKGGSTQNCIATFLSILEDACNPNRCAEGLFAVLYDLTAAYDNVAWSVLALCLERLNLPRAFTKLVLSIVSSTTLRFQTHHGLTEPIKPCLGIPQGDPLSPLLFAIALDPLLCMLRHTNGYHFQKDNSDVQMAAKAYADDLTTFAQSEGDMHTHHQLVTKYMRWMEITVSPKTTLTAVRMVENPDPYSQKKAAALPELKQNITIQSRDGSMATIKPTPVDTEVKYIGVLVRADLHASALEQQIFRRLNFLCAIAEQECRLDLRAAKTFYNTYIYSCMNHLFGARPLRPAFASKLDKRVAACFSRVCNTGLRLKLKPSALVEFGVTLPSMQAAATILDQTLHQARGTGDIAIFTRHKLQQTAGRKRESHPDRFVGIHRLLTLPTFNVTGGVKRLLPYPTDNLFCLENTPALNPTEHLHAHDALPALTTIESSNGLILCQHKNTTVFDVDEDLCRKSSEEANMGIADEVTVATDGSPQNGRFGIILVDAVLKERWREVQSLRENEMLTALRTHLSLYGMFRAGACSQSNESYPPELLAILVAHLSIALNHSLSIVTDSQSAIDALINARRIGCADRHSRGRALINLILHYEKERQGRVTYTHQRSHQTKEVTLNATINNSVDVLVRRGLYPTARPSDPPSAADLSPGPDTEQGDIAPGLSLKHRGVHSFGSVRADVMKELRSQAFYEWQTSTSQGNLLRVSPDRTKSLIQLTLKASSEPLYADLPRFLLRALTGTLPYMCRYPGSAPDAFVCSHCAPHGIPMTLSHPFVCLRLAPSMSAQLGELCRKIVNSLPPPMGANLTPKELWDTVMHRAEPPNLPLPSVDQDRYLFVADRIGICSDVLWLFLISRLTPAAINELRLGMLLIFMNAHDSV